MRGGKGKRGAGGERGGEKGEDNTRRGEGGAGKERRRGRRIEGWGRKRGNKWGGGSEVKGKGKIPGRRQLVRREDPSLVAKSSIDAGKSRQRKEKRSNGGGGRALNIDMEGQSPARDDFMSTTLTYGERINATAGRRRGSQPGRKQS